LGPVLKVRGEQWKVGSGDWPSDSLGNTRMSRASADSSDQQRSQEATPIELTHSYPGLRGLDRALPSLVVQQSSRC